MIVLLPIVIFGLVFGSVYLLGWQLYPAGTKQLRQYHTKKVEASARAIDEMFMDVPAKKQIALLHILTPLVLGAAAFIIFGGNISFAFSAAALGLVLPTLFLQRKKALRRERFRVQLTDALMILISSLRGGLSFLQSIEVLAEEMPAPISEEFGLVLREHKMGTSLEEALERLNKRMPSSELNLITTAVLVSRETGGDIAGVFSKLVESFRESARVMEKVKTLTLQGKLQGIIMSILPVVFAVVVYTTNPAFVKIMFEHPIGRMLLWVALGLQIVGSLLIWRLSKVEV